MLVYFSKKIEASVAGAETKTVTCDKCRTRYFYTLDRVGRGKASAHFFLFQDSAKARAQQKAAADLSTRLANDAELVPCPKCHWINEDLVDRYRKQFYHRIDWYIAVIAIFGVLGGIITLGIGTVSFYPPARSVQVIGGAVVLISLMSPLWMILLVRHLRGRIDPNRYFPKPPVLPPGTPQAWVETTDRATGERALRAVGRSVKDQIPDRSPWTTIRAGKVVFPQLCCVCGRPPTRTYMPPLQIFEGADLPLPLCDDCAARCRRRWWQVVLVYFLIATLSGAMLGEILGGDATGRMILLVIIGLFGGVFGGIAIASSRTRPYRLRTIDKRRGILQIRVDSTEFASRLASTSGVDAV